MNIFAFCLVSTVFPDMASFGPLLLLLMMSYILISTVTISTSGNQNEHGKSSLDKLKEGKEQLKSALKAVLKNSDDIKNIVQPFLTLIQDIGNAMKDSSSDIFEVTKSVANAMPVVGSVFTLVMTIVIVVDKNVNDRSLLKDIKEQFDQIDAKLDHYHMEQKWNIWAAGVYHKPELDIRLAWTEYKTLLGSLAEAKNDDEFKRHQKSFIDSYLKYENAPREMGELLKKTGKSFINNLGDELAEHVKCHEKEILEYTYLILTLIFKGNMMNRYYYKLKDIESKAREDEMEMNVYEAMTAMFEIQKQCIAHSMTYVLQEIKPFIDKHEKRDDLVQEIQSFLQDAYDNYDWMVVGFITLKSSHKIFKIRNKHVLTGFQNVSTQRITVAVARQLKGTHEKSHKVGEVISKCIPESVPCYKVADTLSTCDRTLDGISVSQTYTAVHAYIEKAHQSINANELNTKAQKAQSSLPYIYTGKCHSLPTHGRFVVLIKSDDEIMKNDPCAKLDCEEKKRGRCVRVEVEHPHGHMLRAMCQCIHPYYGLHCENKIKDYEIELNKEAETKVTHLRR